MALIASVARRAGFAGLGKSALTMTCSYENKLALE
jgi:hypothetical protein